MARIDTDGAGQGVVGGEQPDERTRFWLGTAAAVLTVTIWSGWIVATRFAVTTDLTVSDVAILRFGTASLFLAPVLWRKGFAVREIGIASVAIMVIGAGLGFFFAATYGMQLVPAAGIGALLPGTMPVFVAVFALFVLGESIAPLRWFGFGMILVGILSVAGLGLVDNAGNPGILLLPTAAAFWAVFTITLRRSGIDAVHASALVNVCSLIVLLPVFLLVLESNLAVTPLEDIAVHAFIQGVLGGVVALSTYGIAVRLIGASRAAAFAALIPVFVTLFGIPVLGEVPDLVTMIGVIVVSLGVALASGAVTARRRT